MTVGLIVSNNNIILLEYIISFKYTDLFYLWLKGGVREKVIYRDCSLSRNIGRLHQLIPDGAGTPYTNNDNFWLTCKRASGEVNV